MNPTASTTDRDREPSSLAFELFSSLPREIRNHIFAFCVQGPVDNEVVVRYADSSRTRLALLLRERAEIQGFRWVEDPFTLSLDEWQGDPEGQKDLLEAYYWNRSFKFDERQIACLAKFLATDLFGLEMRPLDYVRSLQLHVRPFLFAKLDHLVAEQQQLQYIKALKALATMRTRPRVSIVVDLALGLIDQVMYHQCVDAIDRFLLEILKVVVELKKQGLRIELSYNTNWNDTGGVAIQIESLCSIEDCKVALQPVRKSHQFCASL